MRTRRHDYKEGWKGRSINTKPGVGKVTITAYLQCTTCPTKGDLSIRAIMPPDHIDRKFIQHGWRVSSGSDHRCPTCAAKPKDKPMASDPSPAAAKAQVKMIQLLSEHFDTVGGRYVPEWSDERIATETHLSKESVARFRIAGFGEIKEPTELAIIRADINALEKLSSDNQAAIAQEIAQIRSRLAEASKKMGLAA